MKAIVRRGKVWTGHANARSPFHWLYSAQIEKTRYQGFTSLRDLEQRLREDFPEAELEFVRVWERATNEQEQSQRP